MKYCRKSCEFPPKFGGFDFIGWLYVVMAKHYLYHKTLNSCYVVFSRRKQQDHVAGLEAMATVLPRTQLFLRYFTRPYLADQWRHKLRRGGEIAVWLRETSLHRCLHDSCFFWISWSLYSVLDCLQAASISTGSIEVNTPIWTTVFVLSTVTNETSAG